MVKSPPEPDSTTASAPIPGLPTPIEVRRGRAATVLGLLGVPTVGITAIAGLGLGLAGVRSPRPRWSILGTIVSLFVLAGWLGGLVGFLDLAISKPPPAGIIAQGNRLGLAVAGVIARGVDPADPRTPPDSVILEIVDGLPQSLRRHMESPSGLLAIETLPSLPGCLLRWRIGPPIDPADSSPVTAVDPKRGGIYLYGADGRMLVGYRRALDPTIRGIQLDDLDEAVVRRLVPFARSITDRAKTLEGRLPEPAEVVRLLEEVSSNGPSPRYRPRPGGRFDLVDPESGRRATFAAFGGVMLPLER
ncbi:MAG: hypothetical protein GY921_03935 [Phycisphaeraceae bacterium]|nr:hypothetical protein [Phycisphaeraceae bacterium]